MEIRPFEKNRKRLSLGTLADGYFILGDDEKLRSRQFVQSYKPFCNVRVVGLLTDGQPFHLLVKMPKCTGKLPAGELPKKRNRIEWNDSSKVISKVSKGSSRSSVFATADQNPPRKRHKGNFRFLPLSRR